MHDASGTPGAWAEPGSGCFGATRRRGASHLLGGAEQEPRDHAEQAHAHVKKA